MTHKTSWLVIILHNNTVNVSMSVSLDLLKREPQMPDPKHSLCELKTVQKSRNQPFIMWVRSNSKFQLIKPSNIFVRCYLTISKQMYGQSNRH